MDFSKARVLLACLLSMALVRTAASQDALTLPAAIDQALRRNPDLIASGFALQTAQARQLQAAARPNPELALELENFAGSGTLRGSDALETTLALSQVIELGAKRDARIGVAAAELDLVDNERRAHQLDLLAEVTRRFVDAAAAQQRLAFADEAVSLARDSHLAIARRVDAARSPVAERSRARIALTRAGIEREQAQGALRAARYQLAASWGEAEPQFASVRADLFTLPEVEPFAAWLARLARTPDSLRYASESRLRTAELALAQAQARPNLTLSLGVRRFEESGDAALVAGFSMPIAWSDRNQGAIAAARTQLSQTAAQRDAAHNRTRATLVSLHLEMSSSRSRALALRNDALPLAREALAQTQAGYERGRFSFLELASAQQEMLELGLAAIDAAADHHRLRAELERLTGAATP